MPALHSVARDLDVARVAMITPTEEEFAQFVFTHFGGYWTQANTRRALLPHESQVVRDLPQRIYDRVTELAREYERAAVITPTVLLG